MYACIYESVYEVSRGGVEEAQERDTGRLSEVRRWHAGICVCTYMHTYMHTCMHQFAGSCRHMLTNTLYIYTYVHACIHLQDRVDTHL